jgi:hypothetical protein
VRNRTLVNGSFRILAVFATVLGSFRALAGEDSRAKAFAEGVTVKLPPYIVFGQALMSWQYVSAPNLEVISRCKDWETTEFVEAFVSQDRKLAEILPDFLRVKQSVPVTMILITPKIAAEMGKYVSEARNKVSLEARDATVLQQSMGTSVSTQFRSSSSIVEIIPQVVLWDSESVSMVYVLDDEGYSTASFTPEHVQQLLERRTPRLPRWFVLGIVSIYREIRWNDETISLPELSWPVSQTPDRKGRLTVPEAVMPMHEFLVVGPWGGKNEGPVSLYNRWISQAGLLLRWAFDDKSHARCEALWRFVDASSREPVTEELFRQYFGKGFSEMEKELTDFIPKAKEAPIKLFKSGSIKPPDLSAVRDATASEIGWIKGSFDLKEIRYVREKSPEYLDLYIGQAEADLVGPYRKGVRDPEFLAVLGLYYSIIDKNDLALPFLEQAVAAHVDWPFVSIELERIRKAGAPARLTGPEEGK